MKKILILFGHPAFRRSTINAALREAVETLDGVTFHDLYAGYPDFLIDVHHEQQLCESHDIIIFQHLFYWYSTPAIVKEWFDLVLEHGWAYGSTGDALEGKITFQALTAAGSHENYCADGLNLFTISIFSVLLFQDLAVIPMLAIQPFLATVEMHAEAHHGSALFDMTTLPAALRLIVVLLSIAFIYGLGKYGSRPIFRAIAAARVREVFVATALALVIGISLLMTAVGLSPALGTFIAGVVLADSEYRRELESDIEPFKGLLLGIFFISIGASLNFTLIGDQFWMIGGLVVGLIMIKAACLFVIAKLFKMPVSERLLFSVALAQGG